MNCPSCRQTLEEQAFDGHYGQVVKLDLCFACNGIWFDKQESLKLTPGSILRLFKLIHQKNSQERKRLGDLSCPHCSLTLGEINDWQGSTHFKYFGCPEKHGRFTTFYQFLREKNFVRALNPKEIRELSQTINMINCSNCGAPLDLQSHAQCEYCNTPISILDPTQVQKALQSLTVAEANRPVPMKQQEVDLLLRRFNDRTQSPPSYPLSSDGFALGLVESGLLAAGEILTDVIFNSIWGKK
jgi:Zn-finger nucleic acid-binding protein